MINAIIKRLPSGVEDKLGTNPCRGPFRGLVIIVLAGVAFSICAAGAMADVAVSRSSTLTRLTLEELMNIEVETVYSASKHEQKVTEAPSSVSIITSDDIRKYGYRTLADALKSVRGFYVTDDRNYSYLGVRGFGRPGDYNTRVLLMVDGHAINDNIYDSAAIGTEFNLDVDLIDRIEISRGPSSSLYGSNAFFGIINIVTRNGRELDGAELSADAGSLGTARGRLSYGKTSAKGVGYLVSGTVYDRKGGNLYFPEFDPSNPGADQRAADNGVAAGADGDRSMSAYAKLSFPEVILSGGYISRRKGIPTASYGTVFNTDDTYTMDVHGYLDVKFDHDIDSRSNILARLSYDEYWYYGDYLFDAATPPAPESLYFNKDVVYGRWFAGELKFSHTVFSGDKITLGAVFKDNLAQNQINYNASPYEEFLHDRRKSLVWALYGQDEVTFFDRAILNAGVRYDHYETFGGTVNPRIGVIYKPVDKTAFKFLFGRAFRAPNSYELYYNDGGLSSKVNPDLKPETIDSYEAVFEQYIGTHLRGNVSVYRQNIHNLISLQTDPMDGLLVFRNVNEINARGIEFEMEASSPGGSRGVVSYAVQKAEDSQTHEILTNSPQHLAKFNLSIPLMREKVLAGLEEQYMSRRRTIAGNYAPAFSVMNLTVSVQKIYNGFDVSFSIYNLFDRSYGDPASEEHVQDRIEQDGRNFRLKISYIF